MESVNSKNDKGGEEDKGGERCKESNGGGSDEGCEECKVCFSTLTMPLQLNCGHTFCVTCTRQIISGGQSCPLCRKDIFFASINYALIEKLGCNPSSDDNDIYNEVIVCLQAKYGNPQMWLTRVYSNADRRLCNWYRDNQYEPWMSGYIYTATFKYVYSQRNNLNTSHIHRQLDRCNNQPASACHRILEAWENELLPQHFTNDNVFSYVYLEVTSGQTITTYTQATLDRMDFTFLKWLARKYSMSKRSREEIIKGMLNRPIKREDIFPSAM